MSSFLISPLPGVTGTGECLALKRLETRKGLEEEFIKGDSVEKARFFITSPEVRVKE